MIAALILLAAVTCHAADGQAKLAEANALHQDSKAQALAIPELLELIAEDVRDMAQERANPSGVVDLRALHDIGAALVQHRQALDLCKRTKAADDAACKKLMAEVDAILAVCRKAKS